MVELAKQFSQKITEDGRHVMNLGILSLLFTGYAYARTITGEGNLATTASFIIGILFGFVALYHGRIKPTKYQELYSAGYFVSFITVVCSSLGILLNLLFIGRPFG